MVDHIGMTVPCPHCGEETDLVLPKPPEEPSIPARAIVWTVSALVVLGLGLAGSLIALKRAQRWAESQKHQSPVAAAEPAPNNPTAAPATNSATGDELTAAEVSIDRAAGSSLIYAVGTIKNNSSRQRFGVKVELELSDASGNKIGTATDYKQVLEPAAQWQFKALVVDSKTKSAKVTAIHEDQ